MKRRAILYLGIGVFLSGAITYVTNTYLEDNEGAQDKGMLEAYKESQEELKTVKKQLAELQLDLASAQATQQPNAEVTDSSSPSAILNIQPGMTTFDVSIFLEDSGIIQNRKDLEEYIVDKGLSSKLQVGEYELNATMTIKEIVDQITK